MKRFDCLPTTASVMSFLLLTFSALTENTYSQLNRYWVALMPNVITDATGFVGFKFSDDFDRLIYNVNVHNIDNVTGVYLYLKNDSQSTTPVLDLLKKHKESNREDDRWSDITKEGQTTGTINLSGVTKKDLTGALKGEPIRVFTS